MKTFYTLLISVLFILSSCMTTSTTVGDYKEDSGKQYTYAKGKQFWIGFGLFPIGRTDVQTPTDGSCEVISKFTFGDFLISGITHNEHYGLLDCEILQLQCYSPRCPILRKLTG